MAEVHGRNGMKTPMIPDVQTIPNEGSAPRRDQVMLTSYSRTWSNRGRRAPLVWSRSSALRMEKPERGGEVLALRTVAAGTSD